MYERFTDRARSVMKLANEEAIGLNHEYIGTEHILLGLVRSNEGVAASVLKNLDVDLERVRTETLKIIQSGPGTIKKSWFSNPTTPRVKKVIELATEEARNLNHNYVGTEHLLLGLLREDEGVAGQVLKNLGLSLENVRCEVMSLLGLDLPEGTTRPTVATRPKMPVLPPEVEQAIKVVVEHCRQLREQKEQAVAAGEFEKAAELRDRADRLIRSLNDMFRTP